MDKTAKLILWHRLAILLLISVTLWMAMFAWNTNNVQKYWYRALQGVLPEMNRLEHRHEEDQRVIRDLEKRLKQYEATSGRIEPAR